MPLSGLSHSDQRKLTVFVSCLVLAVITWIFFSLSDKYPYKVKTVINYKNLPQNKAFYPLQTDTAELQLEGSGWQLLFTRLRLKPQEIKVDLGKLEKRNFVVITEQLPEINDQLFSTQRIVDVKPDTLYFDFTARKVKRVPVVLLSNLKFKSQFSLPSSIILKPDYVTISGPSDQLLRIQEWYTDTLKANNLNSETVENITLKNPQTANISIFPSRVEARIPVEEFTEKQLTIPVKLLNNTAYYNARLIPSSVTIKFLVALTDYEKFNEDAFQAVADLDLWKKDNANQLPVKIVRKPPFCSIISINPQQIDFILKK